MPKLLFLIVPLLAACDSFDDGITYTISISSDVPFTHIEFSTVDSEPAAPIILTPKLLATGDRPYAPRFLGLAHSFDNDRTIMVDDPTTDYSWDTWTLTGPAFESALAVASNRRGIVAASPVTSFVGSSGAPTMTLVMSSRNTVEEWGPTGTCERLMLDGTTYYAVGPNDRDCDGIPDAADRDPNAWCSPDPTTDAERAACHSPNDPRPAGPDAI